MGIDVQLRSVLSFLELQQFMKNLSRRSFTRSATMVVGGLSSGLCGRVFGGAEGADLPESARVAWDAVSEYSPTATVYGAAVAGRRKPLTKILAKVSDPAALHSFYGRALNGKLRKKLGDRIQVSGSQYTFSVGGRYYSVENLAPEAYSDALESLHQGEDCFFSHESLSDTLAPGSPGPSGDLAKILPSDHGSGEASVADGFASWFDALIAARTYEIEMTDAACHCGESICKSSVSADSATAANIVHAVAERIAHAAEVLDAQALRSLLTTRLVNESLQAVTGRSAATLVQAFDSTRGELKTLSDSSRWLAIVVGGEEDGGMLHRALTSTNAVYAESTRSALSGAREIFRTGLLSTHGVETQIDPAGSPSHPDDAQFTQYDHWTPAAFASAGDLDGDGIPSLVEYALGSDPLDSESLPEPSLSTESDGETRYLALTYNRNTKLADVEYIPQTSQDLAAGHWTSVGVEDRVVSTSDGIEVRRARVPLRGKRRFLRILVQLK